jgi:hypothetical protein
MIGASVETTFAAPWASAARSRHDAVPLHAERAPPLPPRLAHSRWERSTDAHDTVIETHLHSRHLELPAGDAVIRHHPQIGPGGEPEAIMVALMRYVVTDHPVAVHRTYIDHTGRKTDRKVLGPCGGAAIKFRPP